MQVVFYLLQKGKITDAVAIVVSEERGEISVTEGGNIIPNLDANGLRETLSKLIKINKAAED